MKKLTMQTFKEITTTLKEAAKKSGMKESESSEIVHKVRNRNKLLATKTI